jgi:3-methyladenine DNA glycosylase AlkD
MKQKLLKAELLNFSNKNNSKFANKLKINDEYEILGLKTKIIKDIAKNIYVNEKENHVKDFLSYKEPLFYEEVSTTYFYFSLLAKDLDFDTFIKMLNDLLKYNNSWATNDTLALAIKPNKKIIDLYFNYLKEKITSSNPWDIRFATVSLMKSYLEDNYIDQTLEILSKVNNQEYYVEMALGWAFATALAKQRDKTYPYLFEKKITPRVNKKAIQKSIESLRISESDKIKLKQLREEVKLLI